MKATYQTRIKTGSAAGRALSAYAQLYGHVERRLFAAAAAGESFMALKRGYLVLHGISSRLFNSVKVSLEGKVKAVQASQKLRIDGLKRRMAKAEKTLAKLEKKGLWFEVHHKRRRLETFRGHLRLLEVKRQVGLVRLLVPGACDASSTILKRAGTRTMRHGLRTGVMPAAASFS